MKIEIESIEKLTIKHRLIGGIRTREIETWQIEEKGEIMKFIHATSSGQWEDKGYISFVEFGGNLIFEAVSKDSNVKSYLLGRFVEVLAKIFQGKDVEIKLLF